MTNRRRNSGDETTEFLATWRKDQKGAERLAGVILRIESYHDIDPSQPLGGKDCKKDLSCKKAGKKFIVGVYFPRSQQKFAAIQKKFLDDNNGVLTNKADGIIFFTNQRLTIGQRKKIKDVSKNINTEIYHLERIASILNSPIGYGARLEFLDIELDRTEQLSYFAHKDKEYALIQNKLNDILQALNDSESIKHLSAQTLNEYRTTLETIVGSPSSFFLYGNSLIDRLHVPLSDLQEYQRILADITGLGIVSGIMWTGAPVNKLEVPLEDLKEYQRILSDITGLGVGSGIYIWNGAPINKLNVPLKELEEFKNMLHEIVGQDEFFITNGPINKLAIPLKDLEEYNTHLDETIEKLREIKTLKEGTKT